MEKLFASVAKGRVPKNSLHDALVMVIEGRAVKDVEDKFAPMEEDELKKVIADATKSNPGKNESVLMGIIMGRVGGRATGSEVMRLLRKMLKN